MHVVKLLSTQNTLFGIDRSGLRIKLPRMHPDRMSCWHGAGLGGSGGFCGWTFTAVPPQLKPGLNTSTLRTLFKLHCLDPKYLYAEMAAVDWADQTLAWKSSHETTLHILSSSARLLISILKISLANTLQFYRPPRYFVINKLVQNQRDISALNFTFYYGKHCLSPPPTQTKPSVSLIIIITIKKKTSLQYQHVETWKKWLDCATY